MAQRIPVEKWACSIPLYDGPPPMPEGPIRIAVYRAKANYNPKPTTEQCPSEDHMNVEHFYVLGEDGLLAGGKFRDLLNARKPVQRQVAPNTPLGYKDIPRKPMWVPNRGFLFNCTFLVGAKNGTPVNPCEVTRVVHNWSIAAQWSEATKRANSELLSRTPPSRRLRLDRGPGDKEEGVIGWDTPLVVPDWLRTLIPNQKTWSSPNFPRLRGGRLTFHRGGQTCQTAESVIRFLQTKQPGRWDAVYPHQIVAQNKKALDFAQGSHVYALAAWSMHARLLVKDMEKREIRVYDPWMQKVLPPSWLMKELQGTFSVRFISRAADQADGEGSCQLQAITRLFMAALYGEAAISEPFSASHPEKLAVPVATQLLVTRLRARGRMR
jgi:hypothetical protein